MTDLVDRLRVALDEREQWIGRPDMLARLVAEPRERWEQHHYAAAERLERLRTIQAHRKIIELAEEADMLDSLVEGDRGVGRRDLATDPYLGDVILATLASIYFPESDGESP